MDNVVKIRLDVDGEPTASRHIEKFGDAAEDAGKDLQKMGRDAGFLDKRIGELRGEVRGLTRDFDQGDGDTALLKKIRAANRELNELQRLKKQLSPPDPGDVGGGFLGSLGEMGGNLRGASGAIQGPGIAGAAVLGAAISPLIGAAISSAVIGAAGAGGIAGGIAAAARDQAVKDEAAKLGQTISDSMTIVGQPFVEPLIESLRMLSKEFAGSTDDLRDSLSTVAPVIKPLTEGLDGLIDRALPGFTKGLEAAKPVLRAIGNELPEIGQAVGDFFETVSEDPDGAIMAVKALSQATTFAIRETGDLLATLGSVYESTQKFGIDATDAVSGLADKLGIISPALGLVGIAARDAGENYREQFDALNRSKDASKDFRNVTEMVKISQYALGGALTSTTEDLENQRRAMLNLVDTSLDLRQSTRDVERAIDEMSAAVDENGRSLDVSTEKGRRNQETIDAGIRAIERGSQATYEAARANGATAREAEEAAARYRAQWIPALQTAAEKAGFNAEQVRGLLDELRKLDGKRVEYTLIQRGGRTIGAKVAGGTILAGNDLDGRASGGPVHPGQLYKVGEHGVELLQMGSTGGYVHNATATKAMMSASTAVQPVINVSVNLVPSGNVNVDAVMQMLWPALLKQVRVDGGDLSALGAA